MRTPGASETFAGSRLGELRHACAFFNSDDEEYRTLLPFIQEGFALGHRAVHVVRAEARPDHLARLARAGIDLRAAEQSGQLELRDTTETYLTEGRFDPERMLEVFRRLASGQPESRFPLSRIVCHMDWAAGDRSRLERLVEFESRVNTLWQQHQDLVICVYDLGRFGGAAVVDMLRTHPLVIVGGLLQENPFYEPPEQFLQEYRSRATPGSATSPAAPA